MLANASLQRKAQLAAKSSVNDAASSSAPQDEDYVRNQFQFLKEVDEYMDEPSEEVLEII